ncbi:MAG: ABC-2 transporter permease, partial [Ruminococcus sp.]|nr:ABC-2 transporter permease [Ruminococcus sp.]
MKGLIIKEFIMFKKHLFTFGLIILVFSVTSIFAENSLYLILPVFLSILPVNFMALDEQSKWNQYSLALPYG